MERAKENQKVLKEDQEEEKKEKKIKVKTLR
jgi:hypothetical protein